jgi:YidC/Oxa1 family membrane protein insertase
MDNSEIQKRVILAVVISFIFFILYDYFLLNNKNQVQSQANSSQVQSVNTTTNSANAPVDATQTTQNQAPQMSQTAPTKTAVIAPSKDGVNRVISTIEAGDKIYSVDALGRISQVELTSHKYKDENGNSIKLFNDFVILKPLELRFSNTELNNEAFKTEVSVDKTSLKVTKESQKLTITQKLSKVTVTKTLTFYLDGHYSVDIKLDNSFDYFISTGFRPTVAVDMYTFHGALVQQVDDTLRMLEDEDFERSEEILGAKFAAAVDRYYTTALYSSDKLLNVVVSADINDSPTIFIKGEKELSLDGYIGPKDFNTLAAIDANLTNIIEYGWFTFIAKPMFTLLQYIYSMVGNWGWAIVIITILLKLALYPLSHKGMVSMQKLKDLAPKIKDIQDKYKNEPQKASAHMMELYKKHDANPMGGCLPIILQIPIFFAIYRVLLNAIELKDAPWILWITDLSVMDPFFVLPILMGLTMFIQQKITPSTIQDEMQRKIFMFLPVIFTVFFAMFPAGLTLYWFVNNLFTVGQQYAINKVFDKQREERKKHHK